MALSKVSVSEFITEVERKDANSPYVAMDRIHQLSHLEAHFKAGHFTPADILAYYKQRDTPKLSEATRDFGQGKLFLAQTETFDDWLIGKNKKEDSVRVESYLSFESSAQHKNPDIQEFITQRMWAKRPTSKELDDNLSLHSKFRDKWANQNQRNGWNWR